MERGSRSVSLITGATENAALNPAVAYAPHSTRSALRRLNVRSPAAAAPSIATCRVRATIVHAIASMIDVTVAPIASPVYTPLTLLVRKPVAVPSADQDELLDSAAALDGTVLRGLDAIHLAAAHTLGDELSAIVTYDERMTTAAGVLGLTVVAPQ